MSGYILYRYRDGCGYCRGLQPSWHMLKNYFPRSSWLRDEYSTGTVPLFYIVTSNSEEEEVQGVRKALDNETPEEIVEALKKVMEEKLKDLPEKGKEDVKETIQGILNSIKNLETTREAAAEIKKEKEKNKSQAAQDIRATISSSAGQGTPNPGGYNYGYGYT